MNQQYSPEMRERTLRMLDQARASGEHRNLMTTVRHVAGLLDMSPETLRVWHRRREDPPGLRAPAARRAAPSRDQIFARGEPQRLRGTEDARSPETSGMEHRPRPDHEALRLAGGVRCGTVEEGAHHQESSRADSPEGPREQRTSPHPRRTCCGSRT